MAIFSKPNNVLHIGFLFLLLLYRKEWKKFTAMALVCLLVLAGLVFFNYSQTGELNYQGGERRSFYGNFPLERPDFTFAGAHQMSTDNYWSRFYLSPAIVVYNLFYYFFGRFTGMLIYFFPAFFLLLLFFFQKKRPEDWFLLAGIVSAILCYVLLMPDNYFGGGGALGNRYFMNVFPLFFFLGYRERSFRLPLAPGGRGPAVPVPGLHGEHVPFVLAPLPGHFFPGQVFPGGKDPVRHAAQQHQSPAPSTKRSATSTPCSFSTTTSIRSRTSRSGPMPTRSWNCSCWRRGR